MTFLELCQQAHRDVGTGDVTTIAAVADAVGYQKQVVDYVRTAWRHIQTERDDWTFLRKDFEMVTVDGTHTYAWSAIRDSGNQQPITSLRYWRTDVPWYIDASGTARLLHVPWETMRAQLRTNISGKPQSFSITPDEESVAFHPTPDDVYTITGSYQKGAQTLTADADVPEGIAEEFHDVIAWRAVMMLHGFDNDEQSLQYATRMYNRPHSNMLRRYLPSVKVADTLA